MIKGLIGTLAIICAVNLVPFIMTLFIWFTKNPSNMYSIFLLIRSLFSIPTSLIGFALQYDLGEVWWLILNIFGLAGSIAILKA